MEGLIKKLFGSLKLFNRLLGTAIVTVAYFIQQYNNGHDAGLYKYFCVVIGAYLLNYGVERLLEKKNGNGG